MAKEYKTTAGETVFDSAVKDFKYDFLSSDTKFGSKDFKEGFKNKYDLLGELQGAGPEKYSEIMGIEKSFLKAISAEDFGAHKNMMVGYTQNDAVSFGRKNAKSLADIVWDVSPLSLVDSTFNGDIYDNPQNKAYNGAVEAIGESKKEIVKISTDPQKYVNDMIKDWSDACKTFFSPFISNILEERKVIAKTNAYHAIEDFGASKFSVENISNAYSLAEKQASEIKGLGENADKKAVEGISRKYGDALNKAPVLVGNLMNLARQGISFEEEKKKREEAQKKAEEEARKLAGLEGIAAAA